MRGLQFIVGVVITGLGVYFLENGHDQSVISIPMGTIKNIGQANIGSGSVIIIAGMLLMIFSSYNLIEIIKEVKQK